MNVKEKYRRNSFQYQFLKKSRRIFLCYVISIDELIESTGSVRQTVEVKKRRCRRSGPVSPNTKAASLPRVLMFPSTSSRETSGLCGKQN